MDILRNHECGYKEKSAQIKGKSSIMTEAMENKNKQKKEWNYEDYFLW